jgi:hypothetical protein
LAALKHSVILSQFKHFGLLIEEQIHQAIPKIMTQLARAVKGYVAIAVGIQRFQAFSGGLIR